MTTKVKRRKKKSLATSTAAVSSREICFVIMPFGGWLDDYYDSIYRPAIEAAGLESHRADDLFRPSTIVNDVWAYTKKAKLLVADLSGRNPNVFYELGLAHALAKPAILVAESIDEVPFDLRALRVIVYDKNDPNWGAVLRGKIESSIKEIQKAPKEAVLPAFLDVRDAGARTTVTPHERELIELKQELDLLRREVRNRPVVESELRRPSPMTSARERLTSLIESGASDEEIQSQMKYYGAPKSWVLRHIESARSRSRESSESVIDASSLSPVAQ